MLNILCRAPMASEMKSIVSLSLVLAIILSLDFVFFFFLVAMIKYPDQSTVHHSGEVVEATVSGRSHRICRQEAE